MQRRTGTPRQMATPETTPDNQAEGSADSRADGKKTKLPAAPPWILILWQQPEDFLIVR